MNGVKYPAHWFVLRSRCPFFEDVYERREWEKRKTTSPVSFPQPAVTANGKENHEVLNLFGYSSPFSRGNGFDFGGELEELSDGLGPEKVPVVELDMLTGVPDKIVEQLFLYLYSGSCDLTRDGPCP